MAQKTGNIFHVYRVVSGKGHSPILGRSGDKPRDFQSRETAQREADKHGPKTVIITLRPKDLKAARGGR